jgi:hypothetical protein
MTMRKYEKIKENILLMHQFNTKRFEKDTEITPGPDHYLPNYNLVENNGYHVIKKINKLIIKSLSLNLFTYL